MFKWSYLPLGVKTNQVTEDKPLKVFRVRWNIVTITAHVDCFYLCSNITAACSKPLGMEDGSITNNMISVSSTHTNSRKAWGRLHRTGGSWTPNTDDNKQWFQVSFEPKVKRITHIATQGNGKDHWWVKKYYVMYKKKGVSSLEKYTENNQTVVSKYSCTAIEH